MRICICLSFLLIGCVNDPFIDTSFEENGYPDLKKVIAPNVDINENDVDKAKKMLKTERESGKKLNSEIWNKALAEDKIFSDENF